MPLRKDPLREVTRGIIASCLESGGVEIVFMVNLAEGAIGYRVQLGVKEGRRGGPPVR